MVQSVLVPSETSALGLSPGELVLRVRGPGQFAPVVRLTSPKCSIGSDPRCTLRIRAKGVSPWHCLILRGSETTVVRRWSANTRLDGLSFDDAPLRPGSRLSLGPVEIEVLRTAHQPPSDDRADLVEPTSHDQSPDSQVSSDRQAFEAERQTWLAERGRLEAELRERHERLQEEAERLRQTEQRLLEDEHRHRQTEQRLQEENERLRQTEQRLQEDEHRHRQTEQRLQEETERLRQTEQRLQEEEKRLRPIEQHLQEEAERLRQTEQRLQEEENRLRQTEQRLQEEESRQAEQQRQLREDPARLGESQQRLQTEGDRLEQEAARLREESERLVGEWDRVRAERESWRESRAGGPAAGDASPVEPGLDDSADATLDLPDVGDGPARGAPVDLTEVLQKFGVALPVGDDDSDESGREAEARDGADAACARTLREQPDETAEAAAAPTAFDAGAAAAGSHEEESIEDYMSRLLDRTRSAFGGGRPAVARPTERPLPAAAPATAAKPAIDDGENADRGETAETRDEGQADEVAPRAVAPEKALGLTAMRALANLSAKAAIDQHAQRQMTLAKRTKAVVTLLGLAAGAFLLWRWHFHGAGSMALHGGLAALLVALVWAVQHAILTGRLRFNRSGHLEWPSRTPATQPAPDRADRPETPSSNAPDEPPLTAEVASDDTPAPEADPVRSNEP